MLETRALEDGRSVNPQRVFWELSSAAAGPLHRHERLRLVRELVRARPQSAARHDGFAVGRAGDDGRGVPYAIAAKFAYPERPVIALVGDGAMQMNNMAELITVSKYWQQWSDPRLVVLVLNNQDLNQVTWEQRVMEGDPKFEASQEIPDFPYARTPS